MDLIKRALFFLLVLTVNLNMQAGEVLKAMRNVIPGSYNFLMYLPHDYNEATSKPLIFFIHGASLCGNNLKRVASYGVIHAIDRGKKVDAVVVAPQNPGGSWRPEKLIKILDHMVANYKVDPKRIYVIGMSLGGFGTADFVGTYPERIAAAMEICGGTTLRDLSGLAKVPLWILHGTADRAVKISQARRMKNEIESINGGELLMYSELKGINHSRPARLFYQDDTYEWLFKHTLDRREVDRSYTITAKTVNRPYSADVGRGGRLQIVWDDLASATAQNAVNVQEDADNGSESPKEEGKQFHRIRSGDTLYEIALKYHTSVQQICRLNNIRKNQILKLGKRLRVK